MKIIYLKRDKSTNMNSESMTRYGDIRIIDAMKKYGGSFVKCLAEAMMHADPINLKKLKISFADYWKQYEMIVEREEDKNPERKAVKNSNNCLVFGHIWDWTNPKNDTQDPLHSWLQCMRCNEVIDYTKAFRIASEVGKVFEKNNK
jgi:hypothetical protein